MPPLSTSATSRPRTLLYRAIPSRSPMRRWLVAALLVLTVPMVLGVAILNGLLRRPAGLGLWLQVLAIVALHVAFLIVGWLVVLRRPANPVGWLLLVTAYFGFLADLTCQYGMYDALGPATE